MLTAQPWPLLPAACRLVLQARVTVVQSLPLLEPRLHAPPPSLVPGPQPDGDSVTTTPEGTPKSSAAAAPGAPKPGGPKPLPMAALKGQVLHWAMLLSNAGQLHSGCLLSCACAHDTALLSCIPRNGQSECALSALMAAAAFWETITAMQR